MRFNLHLDCIENILVHVVGVFSESCVLFTGLQIFFSLKITLKLGLMALFTHLKIIFITSIFNFQQ